MENFVVSARKYRPQTFETVVGQEHITTTLKNAIKNNQLAHAFLFCGPRGVGKTTCARILAKTINCENRNADGEACNECASCKSFNDGVSLNIHELDAASNNSVEDIRTLVEQVRFAPQAGKYKVYIVDEVHMLSSSAFNAFLKTLEEPPHYAIFILATTEKHKILPTILSRCQIFDFKRITNQDSVHHLQDIVNKEHIDAETAALQVVAEKSEGCMRDALSILDKIVSFTNGKITYKNTLEHLNILDHDYYFKMLENLTSQNLADAMLLYDEINKKGFDGDIFLNGFAEFMRNLMVSKDTKALKLLDVVETMKNTYKKTAEEVSLSYLISSLNILNEAEINYRAARNKRLHVELTLIKLNYLQQALELSSDGEQNLVIKKKLNNEAIAIKKIKIASLTKKQIEKAKPQQVPNKKQDFGEAKLYIEKDAHKKKTANNLSTKVQGNISSNFENVNIPKSTNQSKATLLESLRQKYKDQYEVEMVVDASPLEIEKLQSVWNEHAKNLQKEYKTTFSKAFLDAKLEITNENQFIVHVKSPIAGGYIEKQRPFIGDEIQRSFANRSIQFKINVVRNKDNVEIPLSAKERLEKIIQANPLVEDLIVKLRLNY